MNNKADNFLEKYVGDDEDIFYNAPHRSPRMPDIERQLNINSRERPLNVSSGFYINLDNKPDNKDYAWVQCYSQTEGYTPEIIDDYVAGGWRLVHRTQHPELYHVSQEVREELAEFREELVQNATNIKPVLSRGERYIRKKGLVLMAKNSEANQMAKDHVSREVREWSKAFEPGTFNAAAQPFDMELKVTANRGR